MKLILIPLNSKVDLTHLPTPLANAEPLFSYHIYQIMCNLIHVRSIYVFPHNTNNDYCMSCVPIKLRRAGNCADCSVARTWRRARHRTGVRGPCMNHTRTLLGFEVKFSACACRPRSSVSSRSRLAARRRPQVEIGAPAGRRSPPRPRLPAGRGPPGRPGPNLRPSVPGSPARRPALTSPGGRERGRRAREEHACRPGPRRGPPRAAPCPGRLRPGARALPLGQRAARGGGGPARGRHEQEEEQRRRT